MQTSESNTSFYDSQVSSPSIWEGVVNTIKEVHYFISPGERRLDKMRSSAREVLGEYVERDDKQIGEINR